MSGELYHYTCEHRAARIGRRGVLVPHAQPMLGGRRVVWLTDLDEPDREGLGLTSHTLDCDRTNVRYRVRDPLALGAVTWREWAEVERIERSTRSALELGRKPRHWYVSLVPVAVER